MRPRALFAGFDISPITLDFVGVGYWESAGRAAPAARIETAK
jgi:hypothetical protein